VVELDEDLVDLDSVRFSERVVFSEDFERGTVGDDERGGCVDGHVGDDTYAFPVGASPWVNGSGNWQAEFDVISEEVPFRRGCAPPRVVSPIRVARPSA
jgi:hypothetical protein